MNIMHRVSSIKLVEIRNRIFNDFGIPALLKNGFEQSPFSNSWFGKDDLGGYSYELCRLGKQKKLEIINVYITKGDSWIKVYLNIFSPEPDIQSLHELDGLEGLQYGIPPNSISEMRLRSDDQKGPPIFYMLFGKEHKLGTYFTQSGLNRRMKELSVLIESDLSNIDHFVKRWYEIHHTPNRCTWEGYALQ